MASGVQVGVGYIDIKPDLSHVGADLKKGLVNDMARAGDEAGKSLKTSLGTAVKGAVAGLGAVAVKNFLGGAIDAARDVGEAVSKSNTVFKENAAGVESWAADMAENFGLSKLAAIDSVGSIGNMFVQLGVGTDQAAAMSEKIVELGVDLRSFHGGNVEDVIAAQTAAFRGEYDSIQRYLPLINQAAVDQRALEMTGKATTKQLTAQDKALAVQQLMFEGAGEAAGDYKRTQGSLANQQEKTNALWTNAKAELGEGLLPMMTSVAKFMNDELVPAFKTLFTSGGEAVGWAADISNAVGDMAGFVVGAFAELFRGVANLISALPGNWGEGTADNLRNAADGADDLRVKLHASKEEMIAAAGAGDALAKAGKVLAGVTADVTKSLTGSNKATRDAAASERDLLDARKDLAALLAEGAVNDKDVADARKSLAEATRSATHADRDLADAQKAYDEALANANDLHGFDTAQEVLADAADGLADAQESSADAHERAREAAADLARAQAGDPDFQDKLADARDRVADAQDKVSEAEQKTIDMAGSVVDATNKKTEALRLFNIQLDALYAHPAPLGPNILGPLAPNQTRLAAPAPLGAGIAGPLAPGQLQVAERAPSGPGAVTTTTTNHITVNVTEPVKDPMLIGKAIAWVL